MIWRDLLDLAVLQAERSTYVLLGLSPLCILLGALLGNPSAVLLPFQAASAFFISSLTYSALKKGLVKVRGRRGLALVLLPSYSTLLGTLVPLFSGVTVLSAALTSSLLLLILSLRVYSALREYYVLM
jgi:hypothetical protein